MESSGLCASFSSSPLSTSRKSHRSSVRNNVSFKHLAEAIERNPCAICLNRIDHKKAAVITQCMHAYCIDCIHKWSNVNRKCPLCKSKFDSWFFMLDYYSGEFSKHRLQALDLVIDEHSNTTPYDPIDLTDVHLDSTESYGVNSTGSYGVDSGRGINEERRARWFGDVRTVSPEIVRERIQLWRKSIYDEQLQAVPLENPLEIGYFYEARKRIEDWLFRELQVVTGIPDPTLIVYMIIPIYKNFKDKKRMGIPVEEEEYLGPLRGFLFEHARLFWHELTCFAESGYSMMTYDTRVLYIPINKD